jgi:hypothetical protein
VWPHDVVLEVPALDARIVNQGGMMSVVPGAGLDLPVFLRRRALDPDNVTGRTSSLV